MVFNQSNYEDIRDLFNQAITKIFGNSEIFLDFIENEKYSDRYDCYIDNDGENYIIDRECGEYINWYKFTHIGRCINISTSLMRNKIPEWFEDFLVEFKESGL